MSAFLLFSLKILSATFSSEMRTRATPCNKIEECLYGDDETLACFDRNLVIWIACGCMSLVLAVAVGLKFRNFRQERKNSSKILKMSTKTENLMKTLTTKDFDFKQVHGHSDFWRQVNVMILFYNWVLPAYLRIKSSELLYGLDVDHHGGNEAEAKCCLKSNLHHTVYKIIHFF